MVKLIVGGFVLVLLGQAPAEPPRPVHQPRGPQDGRVVR